MYVNEDIYVHCLVTLCVGRPLIAQDSRICQQGAYPLFE